MIAVLFEAELQPEARRDYLDAAESLRPLLAQQDGFISVERFASLTNAERLLSLSYWRDEEAVRRWRMTPEHRAAQRKGRLRIFSTYRIRVARVFRDYDGERRVEAPPDSKQFHGT